MSDTPTPYARDRDLEHLIPWVAPHYRTRPRLGSRHELAATHVIIHRLTEHRQFIALHGGDTSRLDFAIGAEKRTADNQINSLIYAASKPAVE